MSSTQEVGNVVIENSLVLRAAAVSAGDLTGEGVYVLDSDTPDTIAPRLILDAGLVLHGLSVRDGGADVTEESDGLLLTVMCASSAGAALVVESPAVIADPADRFSVQGGAVGIVYVDRRPIQLIWDAIAERWLLPNWSGAREIQYTSDGVAYETLESWEISEGSAVGVTAHVTIGYESGGLPHCETVFAHANGRRALGQPSATVSGTDPLNDGGNVAGVDVRWQANGTALELQARTTYVGEVAVSWNRTVRSVALPV